MASSLKEWARKKLGSSKEKPENNDGQDTLRLLFHDNWPRISASAVSMAASYGLFQKLPLEIRQQILEHAFGNRTLHADLTFDHPFTRKSRSRRNKIRTVFMAHDAETGRKHSHCDFGSDLIRSTSQPKKWQWLGCVCHRGIDRGDGCERSWRYLNYTKIDPYEDGCLPGRSFERWLKSPSPEVLRQCESADSDHLLAHDCFIGVTGWLLACRQAYVDGVDVLYRTNTFHMASLPALLNLQHLMAPQRLATITSLELLWHFRKPHLLNSETMTLIWNRVQEGSSPSTPPSSPPRTNFHAVCELIPKVFPNVRHLYIALQANIAPPHTVATTLEDRLSLADRHILGPLEDMFRQIGPGPEKEFTVAIQCAGWYMFLEREAKLETSSHVERLVCLDYLAFHHNHRLWRPLADGAPEGYWLCPGWNDLSLFPVGTGAGVYPLWE